MARVKRSNFYLSVEGKLSDIMMLVWLIEEGKVPNQAQIDYAFKGMELVKNEIKEKLSEVSNA